MPKHDKRKEKPKAREKSMSNREKSMSNLMQRERRDDEVGTGRWLKEKRDIVRRPVGKLKTKSAKEAAEGLGGKKEERDIIRRPAPTPGNGKKPSIGEKLKQASLSAKKKEPFTGVMSPEEVEKRQEKRTRKVEARQGENIRRTEAKTKKIKAKTKKIKAKAENVRAKNQLKHARKNRNDW